MSKTKAEKNINQPKKYSTFQVGIVSLLAIIILILCTVLVVNEVSSLKEQNRLMKEFNNYYQSDELEIIFYSKTGCSYCELQRPILEQIAKDYELEYLDLDAVNLTESQNKEIIKKLGIEGYTPTTAIVKDGKVISTQVGYLDSYKYIEFFINSGILEEGSQYLPEENLTFIEYEDFIELKSSKEPVVVVIGGATCEYCSTAKTILSNLANAYNIPIYYITLDYISADDRLELTTYLEDLSYDGKSVVNEGKLSTPTLLIIKNDEVIDLSVGLGNISSYTKLFKGNGVIKE